jgi:7-cyano-7-deazaguanine synthase
MHVLVLLSGGIDSLACLVHAHSQQGTTSALFVDYGQPAASQERAAVARLSSAMGFDVSTVCVRGLDIGRGCIRGRNGLLLQIGLMHFEKKSGLVSLGVHAGTIYADCSPAFVRGEQHLFDLCADGAIRVSAPFLNWSKRDIWEYLLASDARVDLTYSCERGGDQPCGMCLSCQDVNVLRSR